MFRKSLFSVAAVFTLFVLGAMPSEAKAWTVWTCYGGQWNSSIITPDYAKAVSYANQLKAYGYSPQITSGSKPTAACGAPVKKCVYYVQVLVKGKWVYMGDYPTASAAQQAGQVLQRAYGYKYMGPYTKCN